MLTDAQLIERLAGLYGSKGAPTLLARQAVAERGQIDADIRQGLIERMGDVSVFAKELKQRFSLWFNRRHERFGTLWAERFKSVIVEDQPSSMEAVAAYIDLNPVRAGLVADPKDYRFCGYAAAVAGNALARKGLMSFQKNQASWDCCAAAYQMRLFVQTLLPTRCQLTPACGDELYRDDGRSLPPGRNTGVALECRIEISPAQPNAADLFLHVLTATDAATDAVPRAIVHWEAGRV